MDTQSVSDPSAAPPSKLDWQAVFKSAAPVSIVYAGAVILAAWQGYPGVVCVSPLAWFALGLFAGQNAISLSRNPNPKGQLLEAALSGAIVGLVNGVLLVAISPMMGGANAEEQMQSAMFGVCLAPVSIVVTALVGAGSAKLVQRRLAARQRPPAAL